MSGAVVHDPKDAVGRLIRLLGHDLSQFEIATAVSAFCVTQCEVFEQAGSAVAAKRPCGGRLALIGH